MGVCVWDENGATSLLRVDGQSPLSSRMHVSKMPMLHRCQLRGLQSEHIGVLTASLYLRDISAQSQCTTGPRGHEEKR